MKRTKQQTVAPVCVGPMSACQMDAATIVRFQTLWLFFLRMFSFMQAMDKGTHKIDDAGGVCNSNTVPFSSRAKESDCSGCTQSNDDVTNLAYQHRSKSLDDSCLPASYLSFKYPILSHNNNEQQNFSATLMLGKKVFQQRWCWTRKFFDNTDT